MKPMLPLLLCWICTSCAAPNTRDHTSPLPEGQLRQYQACYHASECVRVDNGCCDCANGGDTIAINRKFEKVFRENFDCRRIICPQRPGDCNFSEPACENGYCKLGPQWDLFPRKNKRNAAF